MIDPEAAGSRVRTAESWEGLLPSLFRRTLTRQLQRALGPGLERLKAEAERRVAEEGGASESTVHDAP